MADEPIHPSNAFPDRPFPLSTPFSASRCACWTRVRAVIDYLGDDSAVVQAARASYETSTKQVNEDRGLMRSAFLA